jgi:hypothetical protein
MPLKLLVLAMGLVAALLGYLGYDRMVKSQIVYFSTSDSWQVVRAGAADGPLLVQSVGDAMGQESAALAVAIAAKLAANFSEPWLKFETDRSKTQNPFRLGYFLDAAAERADVAHGYGNAQLELFAEELRLAGNALGEVTGEVTADELLGHIFSRFCIGK